LTFKVGRIDPCLAKCQNTRYTLIKQVMIISIHFFKNKIENFWDFH